MIPAAKPLIGEEEEAAVLLPCCDPAWSLRARGRRLRSRVRRPRRRTPLCRSQQRHRCPSPRHAGCRHRPRRRSHRPVVHVRGHRQLGCAHGRNPGLCRYRARLLLHRPCRGRGRHHRTDSSIMPVHLYGHPAAMDHLGDRRPSRAASGGGRRQAHGATLNGTPVNAFGSVAAFSFYPTKNMMSGEGGMIVTDDPAIERNARLLRNQGMERRYENEIIGFNARMTDLHAAIGRVQLGKLPAWTAARQANATYLDTKLSGVVVPPVADGAVHVYHQYDPQRTPRRTRRGSSPNTASVRASTTRSPHTGSRASTYNSTCPRPKKRPATCSPFPSTHHSPTQTWHRSWRRSDDRHAPCRRDRPRPDGPKPRSSRHRGRRHRTCRGRRPDGRSDWCRPRHPCSTIPTP